MIFFNTIPSLDIHPLLILNLLWLSSQVVLLQLQNQLLGTRVNFLDW
jgi:hypothetical protein